MNYGDLPKSVDHVATSSSTDITSPGAYVLDDLTLGKIFDDGIGGPEFHQVIELHSRFTSISISQSLAEPFMTLIIGVSDATQIFERLGSKGLQGEEFIKIKLYSPGRDPIDLLFHVTAITPMISDDHQKTNFFNLICTTKEKLINDISNVNKFFSATAADCAQNIWDNNILGHPKYKMLKTLKGIDWKDREFFNSASVGLQDFIIPGLQIDGAMQWLAAKAYGGPDYPGSLYYFFENNLGFHFCNIETYIAINKGSGRSFTYNPQQNAHNPKAISQLASIQHISGLSIPGTTERLNNGTFSHSVRSVDLIDKKHSDKNFNMEENFDSFQKPGNIFNTSAKFFKEIGKYSKGEYLVIKDSTLKENNIEKIVGARRAYTNLLNGFKLSITVYGDSELNVGDVIEINLVESGTSGDRTQSIYSGSWLVQALTHVCDNEKFNTTLSLSKGGLEHVQTKI